MVPLLLKRNGQKKECVLFGLRSCHCSVTFWRNSALFSGFSCASPPPFGGEGGGEQGGGEQGGGEQDGGEQGGGEQGGEEVSVPDDDELSSSSSAKGDATASRTALSNSSTFSSLKGSRVPILC